MVGPIYFIHIHPHFGFHFHCFRISLFSVSIFALSYDLITFGVVDRDFWVEFVDGGLCFGSPYGEIYGQHTAINISIDGLFGVYGIVQHRAGSQLQQCYVVNACLCPFCCG